MPDFRCGALAAGGPNGNGAAPKSGFGLKWQVADAYRHSAEPTALPLLFSAQAPSVRENKTASTAGESDIHEPGSSKEALNKGLAISTGS
jgi:hypothetical protein